MTLQAFQLACLRGDRELFSQLDVTLHPGEALHVVGNNGTGKTSLLRILAGLALPSEGEVRWAGEDIRNAPMAFRSQLNYFGHLNALKDDLLAWENVVISSAILGKTIRPDEAYSALDLLGVQHIAELPVHALSQGQKKRVALARLPFCSHTPLWLLDEPFAALDELAISHVAGLIGRHLDNNGLVVYTTHQQVALPSGNRRVLDLNAVAACG